MSNESPNGVLQPPTDSYQPAHSHLQAVLQRGRFAVRRGVPRPPQAALTLGTSTFRKLLTGELEAMTAQMLGQVRLEGDPTAAMVLGGIVGGFRAAGDGPGVRGWITRRFTNWLTHARHLTTPAKGGLAP